MEKSSEHIFFWSLVSGALLTLIYPIWIGPIAPMTDFGGHLAIADVWTRLDEIELYQQIFSRREGLSPNTVAARFSGWLYPVFEPLVAMRLFTSLCMAGTAVSILWLLRTFSRSKWMIFIALPLIWNGSFYWGMVNYIAVFPLFFCGICLARKTAMTNDWRWGILLALLCITSFFVHGLGCPFTVIAATATLLGSLKNTYSLGWLLSFLPATGLWMYWWSNKASGGGLPQKGLLEALESKTKWFSFEQNLWELSHTAMDATTASWDSYLVSSLVFIWALWLLLGRNISDNRDEEILNRSVNQWLRGHTLLLLALLFGGLSFLLPAYVKNTIINVRLMPLFIWLAFALPRPKPGRSMVVKGTIGLAIIVTFSFGGLLIHQTTKFKHQDMAPLTKLVDQIPEQKRVECLNAKPEPPPFLYENPLDLNCPALVYIRRSGFGGFGFPSTGFNAVKFKRKNAYPEIRETGYRRAGRLQQWDYLLVRRPRKEPPRDLVKKVGEAGTKRPNQTEWHLYRVKHSNPKPENKTIAGGSGGHFFEWSCPNKQILSGVSGIQGRDGTVAGIQPICRSPDNEESTRFVPDYGFGAYEEGKNVTLHCPEDTYLVGLEGREGKFVDELNLLCASITSDELQNWSADKIKTVKGIRSGGGYPYRFTCPANEIATGIVGRSGLRLDAVGLNCSAPPSD